MYTDQIDFSACPRAIVISINLRKTPAEVTIILFRCPPGMEWFQIQFFFFQIANFLFFKYTNSFFVYVYRFNPVVVVLFTESLRRAWLTGRYYFIYLYTHNTSSTLESCPSKTYTCIINYQYPYGRYFYKKCVKRVMQKI